MLSSAATESVRSCRRGRTQSSSPVEDKTMVCGVDVDDKHDLNKTMVEHLATNYTPLSFADYREVAAVGPSGENP